MVGSEKDKNSTEFIAAQLPAEPKKAPLAF